MRCRKNGRGKRQRARESLAACRIRAPSFERVAHLVEALAVADRQDIEDALIDAVEVPEEARSISVSLDRVSVPMEEPRRRPAGRPKKGAPKKPVERKFRMAYRGTVSLHDENGVGRHTIRYGCVPDGDGIGLRDRLVVDAATLPSKRPDLKMELLCDGAPEMWNLLEEGVIPKFSNDLYLAESSPSGPIRSPENIA